LAESAVEGSRKVVPIHTMKAYRGSRGIAPLILNLYSRWRGVVYLHNQATLFPPSPGKEVQDPLNRRQGRAHSWSGQFEEEKRLFSLLGIEPAAIQAVAQSLYCVHYLQLAENSKFESGTSYLYVFFGWLL
jgi:hypothetical protein